MEPQEAEQTPSAVPSTSAAPPSSVSVSAAVSSSSSSASSVSTGPFTASDASVQSSKEGTLEIEEAAPHTSPPLSRANFRSPELIASASIGSPGPGVLSPGLYSLSPTYYDDYNSDFVVYNRMPWKEICLALALLAFGLLGIVVGSYMTYHKVWGDRSHGLVFVLLGALLFIPGFHETRIAYFAWIGYKGFSFHSIPTV